MKNLAMDHNSGFLRNILKKFEIKLVCGIFNSKDDIYEDLIKNLSSSSDDHDLILCELIKKVVNHNYNEILNMNFEFLKPLQIFFRENTPVFNFKNGEIKSNFSDLVQPSDTEFSYVEQLILMIIAISALQQFNKTNLCGPNISEDSSYSVSTNLLPDEVYPNERVLDELSRNGETILMKISQAKLLYLSLILFNADKFKSCITHKWWLFRCFLIQQRIIKEAILDLHKSIDTLVKQQSDIIFVKENSDKFTEVMLLVECAHIHLHYHEVNLAEKCIKLASSTLDLSIELYGAIGKRTRFQTKPVAQLTLKSVKKEELETQLVNSNNFPKDLALQDDTVLNKIEYINIEEDISEEVSAEEQIAVLAHCCLIRKKMATTELKHEEVMAYINFILSHSKLWSIQFKALAIRCQTEKSSTRKFERSLQQLETLISNANKCEPDFSERLVALYCVDFPFKCDLEKLLAELLMSAGCLKSALDIFERIHLWEEAVVCYKQLEMTSKAVEVLERLIAAKPSPVLWCYLGDVTEDPHKYEIAWELSQHKSARSQRSLGYYYFKKKEYEKCLPHFLLSAEINHLQPTLWFTIGYVATQVENYKLAAKAYRQVVLLDDDNFEAWNNLSNAYIKLKQKDRAWRSLQEALKLNYEEWKVWENFLIVSVDVGAFEDVIRAFHRLIDLKGKYTDAEVSGILVRAIDKNLPGIHGLSSFRLRNKALELFGRMTAAKTDIADVWEQYSILVCGGTENQSKETIKKALDFQHKAIRLYSQKATWEHELNAFNATLESTQRFIMLCCEFVRFLEEPAEKQQHKSLAKYTIQNILIKADRASSNFPDNYPQESVNFLKATFAGLLDL